MDADPVDGEKAPLLISRTVEHALLIIDVQPSFNPPGWQVEGIRRLAPSMHSIATVERHDESVTPFWRQLGWKPAPGDEPLVATDKVFVKHGYAPPTSLICHLKNANVERVLVCGIQADTCCLAAGFLLFDAGLHPTMLRWLTVGSSLDRSANLGARLWRHHFGQDSVIEHEDDLKAIIRAERLPRRGTGISRSSGASDAGLSSISNKIRRRTIFRRSRAPD